LFDLQQKFQWSDRRIARELGISSTYLSLLKNGKRPLSPSLMEKATALVLTYSQESFQDVNSYSQFITLYNVMKSGKDLKKQIDYFLLAKQVEGKSQDTLDFYSQNLGRFLWWLGLNNIQFDLESIDVNTIRSFLAYVHTATNSWSVGSKYSEKKASMSTVDAHWRTLQSLFIWLARENVIDIEDNPIKRNPRPRVQKVVQDIPLELIRKALVKFGRATFLCAINCAIILILLNTGMRLSECSGIKMADINQGTGLIHILGKGGLKRLVSIGISDRIRIYPSYGSIKTRNPWVRQVYKS
jgi:site-specific recombinase XerD